MTDGTTSARESMEKSRVEVMECEEEIKSIKAALKSITMGAAGAAESSPNHLEVSVHKVKAAEGGDGDADNSPTTFKINLSSPIEERTITQLYDPLNPTAEGSLAKFESVETSNALLTVEVHSNDESPRKLGISAPHDLLPLCQDKELWRKGGDKKSSTLEVAIIAEKGMDDVNSEKAGMETTGVDEAEEDDGVGEAKGSESDEWEDAVAEEVREGVDIEESPEEEATAEIDEMKEKTEESKKKEDVNGSEKDADPADEKKIELQLPVYTITIQLVYTPSSGDRLDALYDKLNEVSKRKVAAIESLRKNAGIVSRAKAAEAPRSTSSGGDKKPAVKSGFLNKSIGKALEDKSPSFWKRWYSKTLGPSSMLWVVGPIAKNYIIFVGVSVLIHYKGDLLALPPPV